MPNIRDVAKRAGVSITTVSRIMNYDLSYRTTELTRKRVWQAVTELNYALPDRIARAHKKPEDQAGFNIGCILNVNFEKFLDPFYLSVMEGAQRFFSGRGQSLSNIFDGSQLDQEEVQQKILNAGFDALLIISYNLFDEPFQQKLLQQIPTIVSVSDTPIWGDFDLVTYDHHEAVSIALHHLFQKGHTNVAYIGGAARFFGDTIQTEPRCRAYVEVMARQGIAIDPDWIQDCHWSRRMCRERTIQLMSGPNRPTAILAGSDNMAAVVLSTLSDMHLRVPEDVAVVGICDLVFAQYTTPPLTSVRVPMSEIGEYAASLLLSRLEGDKTLKKHVLFPVQLTVRAST